jgi:CheY-like chemotaxis protein
MHDVARVRVLLVEDEDLVRLVIGEELRDAGFDVIEASDADEAITVLADVTPVDLLFTDIRMPGALNGWDLAEQARDLRPGIAVIYATGFSDDSVRMVSGGRFFKKPYRATEIIAAAQELARCGRASA